MESKLPNKRIWDLIEGTGTDKDAATALAYISFTVAKMASGEELNEIETLIAAGMRVSRPGSSVFGAIVDVLRKDPAFAKWVEKYLLEIKEGKFSELLEKFDEKQFRRILDNLPNQFDKLAGEAVKNVLEKAKDLAEEKKEEDEEPERKSPSTTLELTRPDGTSVKVTSEGEVETSEEDDDKDDEPSENDPPTVYGEEDEAAKYLYAIAIDRIECLEVTGYTLAGIFSFGIAAATGVDDEIAFVSEGVARFKKGVRVPFLVPSNGVHADVSDGDVLSDRPEAVSPSNENELKLTRKETFLVNRYVFRGLKRLGQPPINQDFAPFDLEDFMHANITFSLFEDDSDIKDAIEDLLDILQQLASLAQQAFTAIGGGGMQLVQATLSNFDATDAFKRLNKILQDLISSSDKINTHDFIINGPQIKAAFEDTANIKAYPPGADPSSYDYVTDRSEQIGQLNGDGARYRVILRYERHKRN